jgi:hypothetical protein
LHLRLQDGEPVEGTFKSLDDCFFNLVAFGQAAPTSAELGCGDLVRCWTVPTDEHNSEELAHASIPQPSFYLIRPDGHVGLCGMAVDAAAITRYLAGPTRLAVARPECDTTRKIMRTAGN